MRPLSIDFVDIQVFTFYTGTDLIFKNQAMNSREKEKASGGFVNDLLRTEFHKYVVVFTNCPHADTQSLGNLWLSLSR